MAFFSAGLLSLFAAVGGIVAFDGLEGWRSSALPAVFAIGGLALACGLLSRGPASLAVHLAAAVSLGILTFHATLLVSNEVLRLDPISLHGRSSAILFWLIVFSASAYLLILRKQGPALGSELPLEERSLLLLSGVVALAMIESRLENVVSIFYFVPQLGRIENLETFAGSALGGLLTVLIGTLLLAGRLSRLLAASALVLSLAFLGSNLLSYLAGLAQASGGVANAPAGRWLGFQSLVYWSAVTGCAYLLARPIWRLRRRECSD